MQHRQLTAIDRFIAAADHALRTVAASAPQPQRSNPAEEVEGNALTPAQQQHAAGLMRVNHTGEVCAQALYQGQAATAKLQTVRADMEQAAREEIDHLAWCEQRLEELNSRPSVLNPVWYGLSFAMGAGAGLISDKLSLGFVAATEQQVCQHLEEHLGQLPEGDQRSRSIVSAMLKDEAHHAENAIKAGGVKFPTAVLRGMSALSQVMTRTSYRI